MARSSVRPLPQNPSLESLKKQAKQLLRLVRGESSEARSRLAEHHPEPQNLPWSSVYGVAVAIAAFRTGCRLGRIRRDLVITATWTLATVETCPPLDAGSQPDRSPRQRRKECGVQEKPNR